MEELEPPQRLGRFEVIKPLGEGGMGQVFLARDPLIGREVAVKIINLDLVKAGKGRERFIHEAQAAGKLNHPNLITLHEFGEDGETLFLVMEYLPGQDLSALIRQRTLSQEESLEIFAQICDGLACAHEHGIIHRDVKPSNVRVRLDTGRPLAKLMDFGVARMPGSKLTATGDLVGTYSYMAPEYLRGGEAGVQSDLYPVGMMLCEALTGDLPQMGPTLPQGAAARRRQDAKPMPATLSPAIWGLLDKALAPDPAQRFESAQAFSRALRAAIPLVSAPHPPLDPKVMAAAPSVSESKPLTIVRTAEPEPAKHWPWLVAAAAVVGGVIFWQTRPNPAPQATNAVPASVPPSTQTAPVPAPRQSPLQPPAQQGPAPVQGQAPAANPPAPQPSGPPPSSPSSNPDREPSRDTAFIRAQAEAFKTAYERERWQEMASVLEDLKSRNIDGGTFGQEPEVREVMNANRSTHRIPRDLVERVRAYLPPPPGGEPNGPPPDRK